MSDEYLIILINVAWLSLKKSLKHIILKIFTRDAGKYKSFSSLILDTISLLSVVCLITVPIPSGYTSKPSIVATIFSEHGIISLN